MVLRLRAVRSQYAVDDWSIVEEAVDICSDAIALPQYALLSAAHSLVNLIPFAFLSVKRESDLPCRLPGSHDGVDVQQPESGE